MSRLTVITNALKEREKYIEKYNKDHSVQNCSAQLLSLFNMDKCIADAGKKGQCQRDFTLGNYFYDNFNEIMQECWRRIRADRRFKSDVLSHMSDTIEKN